MKENDRLACPVCGEETIAKRKVKMDGFRPCGEVLVCMLCGAELGEAEPEAEAPAARGASSALAQLLGAQDDAAALSLTPDADNHFCRDCRFFVAHPFESRCERHGKEADPMADCPDFEPKQNKFDTPDFF